MWPEIEDFWLPARHRLAMTKIFDFRTTFERRRKRGERLITMFDRQSSKAVPYSESKTDDGRCIPLPARASGAR
jgi:hypothetical protein